MKLTVQSDFSWAHRHVEIKDYKVGEELDTDDEELIAVALAEGWAVASDSSDAKPKKPVKGSAS